MPRHPRPEFPRHSRPIRPRKLARPSVEGLEDRRLLSLSPLDNPSGLAASKSLLAVADKDDATAMTVDLGDSYVADGVRIPLLRRLDRIAVRMLPADDVGAGGVNPLQGLTAVRPVNARTQVYDLPAGPKIDVDAMIAAISGRPGVDWAAPVFVYPVSGVDLVVTDEVIVALQEGVNPADFFAARPEVSSYRALTGTPDQFVATVNVGAGASTLLAADAMDDLAGVAWTSPNFFQDMKKFYMPNDPLLSRQWHLNNVNQTGGISDADVDAPEAWDISPGGSSSVVIAVVDDGMEFTHPDLLPNLFTNTGEVAGNLLDDDGNGWIDDVNGWDFTTTGGGDNNPGPTTVDDAHATSVAGVAAGAGDNGIGTTGMAYKSKILPVRIFAGATYAGDANTASALYYAAGRTANGLGTWRSGDIINNSWGGGAPSTAITAALTWATTNGRGGKGVVTFISSGNSGAASVSYPASLSSTNTGIISVGAVDATDRWGYSQYGTGLDVMASSDGNTLNSTTFFMDGIVTTDRPGANGYNGAASPNGDYTTTAESGFGGTSSASPLTAGIGALMLAVDSNLTAAQVKLLLRANTELIGGVTYNAGAALPWNNQYGYGRVSAAKALAAIGTKSLRVQSETALVSSGTGVVAFSSPIGTTQDRRIYIRNTGTQNVTFGAPVLGAGSGFTIVTPPPVSTLAIGESTSFVVRFTPTVAGTVTQSISFTSDATGLPTYTFTLSGTSSLATSVGGRVFHDLNGSGTPDASDAAVPGVLVFADVNNNGVFDQTVINAASTQTPRTVNLGGFIGSGVVISGATGSIADLNVTVTVNQTGPAGIYLYLVSPAGIRIPLASRTTGTGISYNGTVFDDQAPLAIAAGAPPFTGSFRPVGALSTYAGISPNGEWVLQAVGSSVTTSTTIASWSLQVATTQEPFALTNTAGDYSLTQLPTGSNTIRAVVPAGWRASNPDPAVRVVTLATANSAASGADFALQRANAAYGSVYHDRNGDLSRQPTEEGLAGWSVYTDLNNNGIRDTSAPASYPSADVPRAIADVATTTSTLTIAGVVGTIADINVQVNLTHTYVSDMQITLVSPTGVSIRLFSNRGTSGDNLTNTVFDDQAATAIGAGTAPFTGSFRPEVALAALNGGNANGTWSLVITDQFAGDAGTLLGWSIILTTGEGAVTTDANGNYLVADLPAGSYALRTETPAGWKVVAPASGVQNVTIAAGGTVNGAAFGAQQTNAVYGSVYHERDGIAGRGPSESGLSAWTLYNDLNNNGVRDVGVSTTVNSTDVPKALPDNTTVNSIATVSGIADPIVDLNVRVNLTHTWVADVTLALVGPNGTVVNLVVRRGGSADNFVNTVFDDQAATSITAGSAPFTGSFRPEQALSVFNGISANGTWTLRMTDSATGDSGNLTGWSLIITTGLIEPAVTTDAAGNYLMSGVPNGAYMMRAQSPAGWQVVAPASTYYSGTMAAGMTVTAADFGVQRTNAVYGRVFSDLNANGIDNADPGLAGRAVYVDLNNNGQFDGTRTYASNDVPKPINDLVSIDSTLVVSGFSGTLADLNVLLNITHTWDSDVTAVLIGPNGVSVTLVSGRGGSGDNFTNTVFDDQASTAIGAGVAPFTGSFRPEQALSVFNGINPNGTWTLRLSDAVSGDTGTLTGWSLFASNSTTGNEPSAVTDAFGQYDIGGLTPGALVVRPDPATPASGSRWTTATSYSLTLPANGVLNGNSFGQAGARVSGLVVDSGAVQRSMVRSLTLVVDGRIDVAPGTAFTLTRTAGGPALSFNLVVGSFTLVGDNTTRVQLTFSGAGLTAGALQSLPDGVYSLTVDGSAIVNGGVALDGDGDGLAGGTRSFTFHRFFGDSNGDGVVDGTDFLAFRTAYNTGNATLFAIFDSNGDGVFTAEDLNAFNTNFRRRRLV